jgi:RND family efflux transporter MFP subunit
MVRAHKMFRTSLLTALGGLLSVGLGGCGAPESPPPEPQAVPVRTEAVEPGRFQASLILFGTVQPASTVAVAVQGPGTLRYAPRFAAGLRTGETVGRGELLARVENETALRDAAEARLNAQAAEVELARTRRLAEEELAPAAELAQRTVNAELMGERLAAAEYRARQLEIRAPAAGRLVVTEPLPGGSTVAGGEVLAEVASGGVPRVDARAAAADRSRVRPGLAVRFAVPGSRGEGQEGFTGAGTIREVAPVVSPDGTVRVVVTVTDATGLPSPGEGVEVRVEEPPREAVLTVPREAVLLDRGGAAVFVVRARNFKLLAERRPVTLGGRGGDRVEVLDGLSPGERVVVRGVAFLSDGMQAEETADDTPQDTPEDTPEDTTAGKNGEDDEGGKGE